MSELAFASWPWYCRSHELAEQLSVRSYGCGGRKLYGPERNKCTYRRIEVRAIHTNIPTWHIISHFIMVQRIRIRSLSSVAAVSSCVSLCYTMMISFFSCQVPFSTHISLFTLSHSLALSDSLYLFNALRQNLRVWFVHNFITEKKATLCAFKKKITTHTLNPETRISFSIITSSWL